MSLRATLRERLLNVWAGDPWYGAPSKTILEDITHEEAAAHPLAGAQSIWETALHMVAWTEEATGRIRGNHPGTPARGDWPPVSDTSAVAWKATTDDLRTARYALLEAIEKAHEEDLYLQVGKPGDGGHATPHTRAQTAAGLVEHDVYHLGQVAMLKKALRKK